MNGFDETMARVRWQRHRRGDDGRSARRIAMQARRRQARELGCEPPSGVDRAPGA
jgi:hypothetical protein